jgi:hypothetical protein
MEAADGGADAGEAGASAAGAGRRRPRLRTWLLLAIGLWLMLRQVDGLLVQLQREGFGGYGANDLGPLSPTGLVEQVKAVLVVWQANDALAYPAFYAYMALDTVFIALYAGLLHTLIRRAAAPKRAEIWLVALIAADLLENALRIAIVATGSHAAILVYAAWFATVAKWLTLAAVVLLVANAGRARRLHEGHGHSASRTLWALWRLRIPLLLLGGFGLLLIFDPTGQAPDTFRRWLDSGDGFASSLAWTAGATALLSAVTWTTVRRTVLAGYDVAEHGPHPWRWGLFAVALATIAFAVDWVNLLGFAVVILLVFLLGAFARGLRLGDDYVPLSHVLLDLPARRTQMEEPGREAALSSSERLAHLAKQPAGDLLDEIRAVARALSVWPLLALLLALVSAWTAPTLVLAVAGDGGTALVCALGALAALLLSPLVAFRLPRGLQLLDDRGLPERRELRVAGLRIGAWPDHLELRHVLAIAACMGFCAAAIVQPLSVPPAIGVVGMLSMGMGLLVAGLCEAQRYGETHPATRGLRMLGFDGLPVVGLLALTFAIASTLDDGDYHDVARTTATPPAQAGTTLASAFEGWVARNCATQGSSARTIPMVFVASQGGGIRSAYWTTSVLTELLGAPAVAANDPDCPGATTYDRLFALNGTSGGSLGISSYAGNAAIRRSADDPWYRDAWGTTDLASVPTTWGLLVDLPRSVVGWRGPDRARRFEEAWEERDATLRADFFASQRSGPVLMHASTQVESGCRMNVGAVRLTAARLEGRPSDCAALLERPPAEDAGSPASARLPAAALTSDMLDYLCTGGSLRRSTAALMSARFPYVSPSGRIVRCQAPGKTAEASAVVDGGYAENTAGQAILDLWARLEPAVAAHNAKAARGGGSLIVPVFVDVDNHYAKTVPVGPVARTPQTLVPPLTAGRPDKLDDVGVEQLANARFSVDLPGIEGSSCRVGTMPAQRFVQIAPPDSPGIQAPLAWTLSDMSMDDLDRQRDAAFDGATPAATLRAALRGTHLACEGTP